MTLSAIPLSVALLGLVQKWSQLLRSISGTGCGLGLVVFPCISISHVFERFHVIVLLAAQSLMLLTSLIVVSVLSLLTGMLMVMSSANFTKRFLLGSANCISLTIKENKMGPRTVP